METNLPTSVKTESLNTLCLNMIVRNESRIILRLLESVVHVVDSYCICDTGSTDNTVALIEQFFASRLPPIPGKIVHEPFRDFGYNRTFALNACIDVPNADFILLLDADMVLQTTTDIVKWKRELCKDAYYLFQGSANFYYKNVRIVRNRCGISYWGVTHEFVKTPEGATYEQIPKSAMFINDIGDGGAKADKYDRDVRLLLKGLEDHPNNDRYTFYLANSYRDGGHPEKAIEYYQKRVELGGWYEEVWFSYYCMGKCYKQLGDMAHAIEAWMNAYQFYPKRLENLYEIASHYRYIGKNELSYMFCNIALHHLKNNPPQDYLFMHKDVYAYKLEYEMTVIGYYCNLDGHDLGKMSMKVLAQPFVEDHITRNVLSNYKFYAKPLKTWELAATDPENVALLSSVGKDLVSATGIPHMVSSTPSIVYDKSNSQLIVCVRYVNYRVNDKGGYDNRENITTVNVIARVDIREDVWRKTEETVLDYNRELDGRYVGLEDVRLHLSPNKQLMFNANRGIGSGGKMAVEHGEIGAPATARSGLITMEGQHTIEKNWVLLNNCDGKIKTVYGWYPLRIGDIIPEGSANNPTSLHDSVNHLNYAFVQTHQSATPDLFKHVRGSTNGITIDDEIWFLCHVVSYEDRRYYYHLFVVLDADTLELKRYTRLFTFDKEKVEYSLGFVFFRPTNRFLLGFSRLDRTTEFMYVSKSAIELLFQVVY
jgi:glycosyltransferase involved in cell wall biosynthesis